MIRRTYLPLACVLIATAGCQTVYETAASEIGAAEIRDTTGRVIGQARLFSLGEEVTINLAVQGLSAGVHATHLHTTGDCSAADFTSAGGHLNPGGNQHGTQNPRGAHLGDLPNLTVGADGAGTMSTILRATRSNVLAEVFDGDGTALVIHETADDMRSDPAGAAGSRIACGVVTRS